jgi:uncharacterized membrane protein (UPF0182 family)
MNEYPEYLDPPEVTSKRRLKKRLLLLGGILLLLLLLGQTFLADWVDLLWFESLGFGDVFWKTFWLKSIVFSLFTAATFALLFGAFALIRRCHADDLPKDHAILIAGQKVTLSVAPVLKWLSWGVAAFVSLFAGLAMLAEWPILAMFWYAAGTKAPQSVTDPIFGKPLTFYLFSLPAWQLVDGWLLTLALATVGVAIAFLVITSGARTVENRKFSYGQSPFRGLSATGAFLLAVIAMSVFVDRYQQLLEHHTLFDGINYTDAHVTIHGLLILSIALLLGAIVLAVNAVRETRGSWIAAAIAPAALCFVGMSVAAWYTGTFIVKPNELVDESPYIAHNIQLTRQAYGLDTFAQSEFPAETNVDAADPANNQPTLNNIRLWDWHALQDTLRQVQEIRTYYDFPDIDIDRYIIDGHMREVMLAERELNVEKLPVSSRNWINEKLIYTHGYGVTMNGVNGFTSEGLPILLLSNMPVQSTVPTLKVTRPQLYFGEMTDTDVYVKTRQQEFDYPQGQNNTLTSYEGTGGIPLGGFLKRVLLAADRGDLGTLPFSDDVNAQSRLLMRRNIRERVAHLAPFLTFDQDPYVVVGDDGRLSWIMDAFTTSNSYPYATHYSLAGDPVNYMRNSVKVVIDAYNGSVTFYDFDPADPVLSVYRRIFPGIFRDASTMPADLRKHVRYPEALFNLQSDVYGLYHMTNPEVFFNREDLWTVATETTTDSSGNQIVQPMAPNFVLMKLPGGTSEEFVEILPFTPANRNNLIGWIAGRCDGKNYGTAVVYDFPKTRLIDGPQQIEARIDQNAQLSGQLTLWNQQGSHVLRGSLLVIPSGKALLYAEPIYLQAQQSPMPELRLVVLALQDKLAYGTTFQAALSSLFGNETSSLNASTEAPPTSTSPSAAASSTSPTPAAPGTPNPPASTGTKALIAEAGQDFDQYQKLTAQGKLAEAGQKLEALKSTLAKLQATRQ